MGGGEEVPVGVKDARWLVRNLSHHDSVDVADAAVDALASSFERQELARGQLLYEEGTIPAGAWAIRSGRVELSSRLGGKRSIVQILRAGAIAGDLPILLESPSMTTAHVGEEGSFLFVDTGSLRSLLKAHGDLSFLWLHNVSTELKAARIRILQLLGADLAQSVARVLVSEAVDERVDLPQSAIAELLGVQRTSVNRVLMTLGKSGVVDVSYGSVKIRDRVALTAIAAGEIEPGQDPQPRAEQTA
jgi:CRP-like cAMP-binding protein